MGKTWKKVLSGVCAVALTLTSVNIGPAVIKTSAAELTSGEDWLTTSDGRKVKLSVRFNADGDGVMAGDDSLNAADGNASLVFDGDANTGVIFRSSKTSYGGNLKVGDYVQVEFETPFNLGGVTFTFASGGDTYGANSFLEYTTDGSTWKKLTSYDANELSTATYTGTVLGVKAVRLVNGTEKTNKWLKLREISFTESSLVSYYSFDNITDTTLVDECGNHNGTILEGATIVDGRRGKALSVNEASAGAIIDDYDTYDGSDWSVAYWVKATSDFNQEISVLEDTTKAYSLSLKMADGRNAGFRVGDGSGDVLTLEYEFEKDTWYHIAWTQDKDSAGISMYVNGVRIKGTNWTVGNAIKAPFEVIGGTGFTGIIDDVRIYKEVISENTIVGLAVDGERYDSAILKDNAKANSWHTGAADGPAGFAFDENTGTRWHSNYGTATDENKNGNVTQTTPIWIQTGFDKAWGVKEVHYTAGRTNNVIENYTLQVAVLDDPSAEPDDTTEWETVREGTFAENANLQRIILDEAVLATHVRLNALSTRTANGYVVATEIAIYGESIDADYTKVYTAIAAAEALNRSLYTDNSLAAVDAAIAAVIEGKDITKQEEVDAMAAAIENAIASVVYKDADYTAVDRAKADAAALDRSLYTDNSLAAVDAAVAAVVEGLSILEQETVDGYAAAINEALQAVERKKISIDKTELFLGETGRIIYDETLVDIENITWSLSEDGIIFVNEDGYTLDTMGSGTVSLTITYGETSETFEITVIDAVSETIDRSEFAGITATANTQETSGEGDVNGYVSAAVDGNSDTFWHSAYSSDSFTVSENNPAIITVDLGKAMEIGGFRFQQRNQADRLITQYGYSIQDGYGNVLEEERGIAVPNELQESLAWVEHKLSDNTEARVIVFYVEGVNNSGFGCLAEIEPIRVQSVATDAEIVYADENVESITVEAGKTVALGAEPVGGHLIKGLIWDTSDSDVAMVDENGVVTGVKAGEAVIKISNSLGQLDDCTVTVFALDADYSAVDAAIEAANGLVKENYVDFSAVEAAIEAVVRGKDITAQEEVDAMAKAITDAIAALELIEVEENLAIVVQPMDAVVLTGETAEVAVEAQGKGLTYTWYYKNPGNKKFYASGDSFANGNAYSIPMYKWRDGQEVYCVITDAYGNSVQSDTVTLSIRKAAVEIVTQPGDVVVETMGNVANVTVIATGEDLTYTWYYKNPGNVKFYASGAEFVSEDGATYTIPVERWRNGQQVYCVIKDTTGATVQTNTVTLSVAE